MFLTLPVFTDTANNEYQIALDGKLYFIALAWNNISQAWIMRLRDEERNLLIACQPIRLGLDLFKGNKDTNVLPPGVMFAYDTTETGSEPTRDNLGTDVLLMYTPFSGL